MNLTMKLNESICDNIEQLAYLDIFMVTKYIQKPAMRKSMGDE